MRGRKPQPIEQRIREGNTQQRPIPQPVLVGGRPDMEDFAEPPAGLPPDGKKLWRRDVGRLVEVGIVDRVDVAALEGLCVAYARAKQAGRIVNREGLTVDGSRGQPRPHPAVKIERESWLWFDRLGEQYGLTPIARTRLGLAGSLARRSMSAELDDKFGSPDLSLVEVP
jgi:P27 family predicted phage terminase small subunit